VTTTTTFTVNPPALTVALSGLVLARTTEPSGGSVAAKVTLSAPAPAGGTVVLLASSMPGVIRLPSSVTVRAGQTSSAFKVDTTYTPHNVTATLSATYAGTTKTATLTATAK
jgi:hypothetical protein